MGAGASGDIIGLLLAVLAFAMSLPAAYDQYRKDRSGFWKTLKLMGYYALYTAVGLGVVLLSMSGPQPSAVAVNATIFVLSWIAYGALWLVRLAPRYQSLPVWVDKWCSPLDVLFGTVILITGVFVVTN